jgi:NAD(P)-dependent dehydrogenase (short-subunit alcohol dehydrogenase family)
MLPLQGKVAVVAGATRGAGRGIARALGEAGAMVYCTGRSVRNKPATSNRPETIDETAEMIDAAGGTAHAVRVDHADEEQVTALFERVRREQQRLDILVNDIWGGEELTEFGKTFWDVSLDQGFRMMRQAVNTHIITSRYGAPLLLETGGGLIVEVTDGNSFGYRGNLFYDLVKSSVIRLAFGMAYELRRRNVTAIAMTPGFLRSEAMLEHFGVTEANWEDGAKNDPNFAASESPLFVGRAIAALAADSEVFKKSGRVLASWDIAEEYGFTDADGRRPHWGKHFEKTYGAKIPAMDEAFYERYGKSSMEIVFPEWP